ncbi:MAG TPA: pantoate--beta-alanine ligase [Dehalococcoidia bacterium]|nr:pantoate--beta-alanine ligase [Dehalococcoidia bacterium]
MRRSSRTCSPPRTSPSVDVLRTIAEVRQARAGRSGSVGFVPTMGYLHEGHLALVRRARAENDRIVASIFVNPTQFGPQEDFQSYPRDEARDLQLLAGEGVDAVFLPAADEMYPEGAVTWIEVSGPLTARLEGVARPGHFRGVTTVVAKLFYIVQPQRAYFGQKDAQQLLVVRRMVRDLALPVEVVAVPTVRDSDGLALSSRNVYLPPEERKQALALPRALLRAQERVAAGERDAASLREGIEGALREAELAIDYVSVADAETLEELETVDRPALALAAVRAGQTRLIDNVELGV